MEWRPITSGDVDSEPMLRENVSIRSVFITRIDELSNMRAEEKQQQTGVSYESNVLKMTFMPQTD